MPRSPIGLIDSSALPVTVSSLTRAVQRCAFWLAALLPLGYVPLLFVGSSRLVTLSVVGKLVAVNVVALLLGHGYAADAEGSDS